MRIDVLAHQLPSLERFQQKFANPSNQDIYVCVYGCKHAYSAHGGRIMCVCCHAKMKYRDRNDLDDLGANLNKRKRNERINWWKLCRKRERLNSISTQRNVSWATCSVEAKAEARKIEANRKPFRYKKGSPRLTAKNVFYTDQVRESMGEVVQRLINIAKPLYVSARASSTDCFREKEQQAQDKWT